jgi:signal peptidase I
VNTEIELEIIQEDKMIKRNPFIAAIFTILTTGLGQIYNGQLIKGIIFLFIPSCVILISSSLDLYDTFQGLIIMALVSLAFFLYVLIDAIIISVKKKSIQKTKYNRWYIYLTLIILIIFIGFPLNRSITGIYTYIVDGPSMQPSLHASDRFVANHKTKNLKRGDIIIFKAPEGKTYIKRIVAVGGDTLKIQKNKLYINDKPQEEAYVQGDIAAMDFAETTIPADTYFTLGDNRANSIDSRAIGPIPRKDIIGKALYVFFKKGQFVFRDNL